MQGLDFLRIHSHGFWSAMEYKLRSVSVKKALKLILKFVGQKTSLKEGREENVFNT